MEEKTKAKIQLWGFRNNKYLVLNNKNNQGFTLIELMIALAVFTIGISAALSLALANYNTSRDNLDKIVAANLAREGIELIRNVRDSNWLRVEANETCGGEACTWDYGLSMSSNGFMYIDYNDLEAMAYGGGCLLGISWCPAECPDCVLYKNIDGYYNHDDTGTETKYLRAINLKRICVDESALDPENRESFKDINSPCDLTDTFIGIRITSHVEWEDNGLQEIEITDQIYNWRR